MSNGPGSSARYEPRLGSLGRNSRVRLVEEPQEREGKRYGSGVQMEPAMEGTDQGFGPSW